MVGGYVYEDNACLACHPTGDADNVSDHNLTAFPLTGAHLNTECLACHGWIRRKRLRIVHLVTPLITTRVLIQTTLL
ncbi:MAG: hypothetical protein R2795_22170 [Saprospiraceae bacterium]